MSLPDTSAKEVGIFWLSLNLAKETDPGMYGIIMMKICILSIGDFIISCCNFLGAPRLTCSLLYEMIHQ